MKEKLKLLKSLQDKIYNWQPPVITSLEEIKKGDMPGDVIHISEKHIEKTNMVFPDILKLILNQLEHQDKIVLSIHGGSGVGKSETGALVGHYLSNLGLGSYILSGDNYPKRIPESNDAERMRVYKDAGLKGLVNKDLFTPQVKEDLVKFWADENDADEDLINTYPWLKTYQHYGKQGLKGYLGTPNEINFDEINQIIDDFKSGKETIALKRMGRFQEELWYDSVDFSDKEILIIEWTHGNNKYLKGVDIPVLLNSTPEETLAHRQARNRDGKTDSAFVKIVLSIEQSLLFSQASRAKLIVSKSGMVISYDDYLELMNQDKYSIGPMLNAYPDSIGGNLDAMTQWLKNIEQSFDFFYILPSMFNSDLDRGFSVIDYNLNKSYVNENNLSQIRDMNIDLKLDFILNHASVLSPQFQDLIQKGQSSLYKDFFINWNEFWDGYGENENGTIIPDDEYLNQMFFRKPGLPILNVKMPDGEDVPYWNTFYQEITYDKVNPQQIMKLLNLQYTEANTVATIVNQALTEGKKLNDLDLNLNAFEKQILFNDIESSRRYLGQMDLNIKSPLVWDFYDDTLSKLAGYGASIVRLDAFAYAPKTPGKKNFLNDPDTWELLERVNKIAKGYQLTLLPEIHARYEEGIHNKISEQGYMTYDFFFPGLVIDALERQDASILKRWINEILEKDLKTVNMLGCHDGIPLLDLKGLLSDEQISNLIDVVVSRGGHVKDLHGKKNMYYQVNATYFSALGESEEKLLLARALQMFMPGKPQVWYLDLLAGTNDYQAVERAGAGGHKEINRTNLSLEDATSSLDKSIVKKQLELLDMRQSHPVFEIDSRVELMDSDDHILKIKWTKDNHTARLDVDFKTFEFRIEV